MLKKITTAALTILGVAALGFGVWSYLPKAEATTEYGAETATVAEATKENKDTDKIAEELAKRSEPESDVTEPKSVKTVSEEEVQVIPLLAFSKDEAPNVDEFAYVNVATEEELHEFIEFLESQPDADENMVKAFYQTYGDKLHNWKQTPSGEYVHLLYDRSLMQTDETRPKAAVELGLNKKQIDDAVSFPFTLNEEQVKKILAAGQGQRIAFSDEEVEAQVWEYIDELLGSYVLAEDGIRRLSEQKIADYTTVGENWKAGSEFLAIAEASRTEKYEGEGADPYAQYRGKGANIWLKKIKDGDVEEHYTTEEYQKYVISFIMMLLPRDARVQVLTALPGNHSHLIAGDFNSMRVTTNADYKESLASLVFPFYTKTGKVALYFGINERDKRSEILNYTVQKKPVERKKVERRTTQEIIPIPDPSKPSNPTPGPNPPGPNPPGPTPTPTPPETKSPAEDPVFNGNANTGGGPNDDPGPGPYKPDQGNSKSDTVEGSQYQQGNSPSDTGAQPSYDPGPAADNTDNGTPPSTAPIEQHESHYEAPSGGGGGGGSASAGDHNGAMAEPPAD